MPARNDELRQYALMHANKICRENPAGPIANAIYAAAKDYPNGDVCPDCWVREMLSIKLEEELRATAASLYCCKTCDFQGAFPNDKQITT